MSRDLCRTAMRLCASCFLAPTGAWNTRNTTGRLSWCTRYCRSLRWPLCGSLSAASVKGGAAADGERDGGGAQSGQGGQEVGEPRGPGIQKHHPHAEGEHRSTRLSAEGLSISALHWFLQERYSRFQVLDTSKVFTLSWNLIVGWRDKTVC